jgi:hypothetical protein
VISTDAAANATPAPTMKKTETIVQIARAARVLAERSEVARHFVDASTQSVQDNRVLADSSTQTTEPPRNLVDFYVQVQDPPRQMMETAVQAAEPARAFANSTTQTVTPPATVPAAEYEKVLMEVEELRRRLQDVETKQEEVNIMQIEEEVDIKQEADEQEDTSIQLPNGGPKVSVQAFAAFLGAKLNRAFAPQVVDTMPEDGGDEEAVEGEDSIHDTPPNLAPVAEITAPIPNISPDMYATYQAIAGKEFTIPADPDVNALDRMPLRQWIMAALRKLYVDRLSKCRETIKGQASEQVQKLNIAATQALGQGNHTLMVALWQLAQAYTLSTTSPDEMVKGSPTPAYVTVDWKGKRPMDDDRIGQSFYKVRCTCCFMQIRSDFDIFCSSNGMSSTPSATTLPLILSSFPLSTSWSSRSLTLKGSTRTSSNLIGSRIHRIPSCAKPAFGSNKRLGCGLWMRICSRLQSSSGLISNGRRA